MSAVFSWASGSGYDSDVNQAAAHFRSPGRGVAWHSPKS
jgi:hypothetical protein